MLRPANEDEYFHEPEATVRRFYNAILGTLRNWPIAYSCLCAEARESFEARQGMLSFADYWEDRLSFLEELVRKRHQEYPYVHRSCFVLNQVRYESQSVERAVVVAQLVENHLGQERLVISQQKLLVYEGRKWLLTNGELEGNWDEIIIVRNASERTKATPADE